MRCSLLIVSTICTGTRIVRCLVGDAAGDRLADPPGRVGRELVAGSPVVLLDGAHEADVALLDEVEEEHAAADVALRDRHHETQVGLDQLAARGGVVALDALGQRDLLGGGQQRGTADLAQVGAHRIVRPVAYGHVDRRAGLELDLGLVGLVLVVVEEGDDLEAEGVARHAGRGELTAEPDAPATAGALVHLDARDDEAGRCKPAPEQIGIEPRPVHTVARGEDRAAQPHGSALGRHFVLSFRRCLVPEERLEGSERLLVGFGEAQPLRRGGELRAFEAADVAAAIDRAPQQTGALEHLDVLRRGREGHRQRLGELTDGQVALGESAEHVAAGGVRERVEDLVQRHATLNHMVERTREPDRLSTNRLRDY